MTKVEGRASSRLGFVDDFSKFWGIGECKSGGIIRDFVSVGAEFFKTNMLYNEIVSTVYQNEGT